MQFAPVINERHSVQRHVSMSYIAYMDMLPKQNHRPFGLVFNSLGTIGHNRSSFGKA